MQLAVSPGGLAIPGARQAPKSHLQNLKLQAMNAISGLKMSVESPWLRLATQNLTSLPVDQPASKISRRLATLLLRQSRYLFFFFFETSSDSLLLRLLVHTCRHPSLFYPLRMPTTTILWNDLQILCPNTESWSTRILFPGTCRKLCPCIGRIKRSLTDSASRISISTSLPVKRHLISRLPSLPGPRDIGLGVSTIPLVHYEPA